MEGILNLTEGVQEYRRERGLDFDIKSFLEDKPGFKAIHRNPNCSPAIKNFAGQSEIPYAGSDSTRVIRYRPAGVFVGDTEAIKRAVAERALTILEASPLPVIIPTGRTYEGIYDELASERLIERAKAAFSDRILVSMDQVWYDEELVARLKNQNPDQRIKDNKWSYSRYHTDRDGDGTGKGIITQLGIDPSKWIIPDCSGADIDEAVDKFYQQLLGIDRFSLIMGGIGPDAKDGIAASPHFAFMTPNMPPSTIAARALLDSGTRSSNGNGDPNYCTESITIGPGVVQNAQSGIAMALGGHKRENSERLALGGFDPAVPVTWVQTIPNWNLYMDEEAGEVVRKELKGGNISEV